MKKYIFERKTVEINDNLIINFIKNWTMKWNFVKKSSFRLEKKYGTWLDTSALIAWQIVPNEMNTYNKKSTK